MNQAIAVLLSCSQSIHSLLYIYDIIVYTQLCHCNNAYHMILACMGTVYTAPNIAVASMSRFQLHQTHTWDSYCPRVIPHK